MVDLGQNFDGVIFQRHGFSLALPQEFRQIVKIFGAALEGCLKLVFQGFEFALTPTGQNHALVFLVQCEFAGDPIGVHECRHANAQNLDFVIQADLLGQRFQHSPQRELRQPPGEEQHPRGGGIFLGSRRR